MSFMPSTLSLLSKELINYPNCAVIIFVRYDQHDSDVESSYGESAHTQIICF